MFSVAQITKIANKFFAQENVNGDLPLVLTPSATAPIAGDFYSGFDLHDSHVSGDSWIGLPQLIFNVYQRTGSTALYSQHVAAIRTALARIPRNPHYRPRHRQSGR